MPDFDFDLFVIGAGSGGVRASRVAANHGARVGICEDSRVGGTCVIRGCIPKKFMVYASHFAEHFEDAADYGWHLGPRSFSWPKFKAAKDKEIDRLNQIYLRLLDGAGVSLINGRGTLVDAHTVDVDGQKVTADKILIATGGWPFKPQIGGIDHAITSNEFFELEEQPRRVIVVGGGFIAVEFAGILNGLGSEVTQIYRGEQILRGFDEDVRATLAQEMRKKGVNILVESNIQHIEKTAAGLIATCEDGNILEADCILYATGRAPKTAGLNLESVGVELKKNGAVVVDRYSQTSVNNIYAVGDVTDRINLTPVALNEGLCFADTVFGGRDRVTDHENVASAVFSQPGVGTVGLTEQEARSKVGAVDIYKSTFRPLIHTLSGRDEKTMMKIVVDQKTDKVMGAHMVGPDAAEIIQGLAVAVKMGATKTDFDATVGIHPTSAEEFVTMRERYVPPEAEAAE
jgi:glutathione reductase (NADPH)